MINAVLAVIGVLAYALTLSNSWGIWGVDYLVSMPLWLRTVLVAILAALAIPWLGLRFASITEKALKHAARVPRGMLLLAVLIFYAAVGYLFRSYNHALGDGHNLLANIARTDVIRPTEPLEYYLHLLIFRAFFTKLGAALAYLVLSLVAGIGFIVIIKIFIKDNIAFIAALAVAAAFGTAQFFFGYVEHYTFALVFIVLFLLSGLRDLERKKPSWLTYFALLLAVLSHLYALMFFPAVAFLIWKTVGRKAAFFLLSLLGAILVGSLFFGRALVQTPITDIILPLTPTTINPYSIFCSEHLGDMLSLAILSFPLIFALPIFPFGGTRQQRYMLCLAILPALAFAFTMDPSLGAVRDWDLLSAAAAPILVWLIFSIGKLEGENKKFKHLIFAPLALFAFFHTGGWIYHNTSLLGGYERIKHAVANDLHYSDRYHEGYRNKSWSVIAEERYADRPESIRASLIRYRAMPLDPVNTVHLAEKYFAVGDTPAVIALCQKHWRDFIVSTPNVVPAIGGMLVQAKRLDLAERIFADFLARGYMEFTALHNLAYCLDQRGQTDSAMAIYQRAFDSFIAPVSYEMEYYLRCVRTRRIDNALRGFRKMMANADQSSRPEIEGLIQALEGRDFALADSLANNYAGKYFR